MTEAAAIEQPLEQPDLACPQCGAKVPVDPGFVTWCDKCGWNVQPYEVEEPKTVFDKLYVQLGQRYSKRLFDELSRRPSLKPHLTWAKLLAFAIAAITHGVTLLFAFLCVYQIVAGWPGLFPIGVGIFCGFVAWVLRPRLSKLPKDAEVADPEEFSTLYRVAGEVAAALGTKPPSMIVIDEQFNASYRQIGWRQKKVVTLGLPLLANLDGQELVGLLGHELGHGVNGDSNRGFFVRTAVTSLNSWYVMLHPGRIWDADSLYAVPGNAVLWLLSALPLLGLRLLANLMWQDSQRAEYLADALAARVAGTSAELSSMDKTHLSGTFYLALHHVRLAGGKRDLFEEFRSRAAAVPPREIERIRRVEQLEQSRLDATHPPTVFRLQMLRAHPVTHPQVVLSDADFAQIWRELATVQARIQEVLVDR